MKQQTIVVQCNPCDGEGVIRSEEDPKGVAFLCLECGGVGKGTSVFTPYSERIIREDIRIVKHPVTDGSVSYEDFLRGMLPE